MARVDHLPPDEFWVRNGDVLLRCGGQCFLGHRAVLALNSAHLSALIAVQAEQEGCDRAAGLPLVSVLPAISEGAPAGAHFGTFLHLLYRTRSDFEWDTIADVLELADYFGASSIIDHADAWICEQLRKPQPAVLTACRAFEVAARHRLGAAMALLLPWAVRCMALGSRCSAIWYDGKQQCCRLKAAFEDSELKCMVLDAYWWARSAPAECPACHCRPADVEAGWDTRREWAAGPTGRGSTPGCVAFQPGSPSHTRASLHYAHLLADLRWGVTHSASSRAAAAAP